MIRKIALLLATMLLLPLSAAEPAELLEAINRCRIVSGAPPLTEEAGLTRTASAYSRKLVFQGALTHRDSAGNGALQRYRTQGGTAAVVGEILGAGPDFETVVAAWLTSPAHRELLLAPHWTEGGAGSYSTGKTTVYVILFIEQMIRDVQLIFGQQQWELQGRLIQPAIGPPLIRNFSGLLYPQVWDPATGSFRFNFPADNIPLSLQLGYIDTGGHFLLAHVLYPRRKISSPSG